MTRCSARHWFAYRGMVGSSSPRCTRPGCDALNPKYDSDYDPYRIAQRGPKKADL
jgi:hypothetical protein